MSQLILCFEAINVSFYENDIGILIKTVFSLIRQDHKILKILTNNLIVVMRVARSQEHVSASHELKKNKKETNVVTNCKPLGLNKSCCIFAAAAIKDLTTMILVEANKKRQDRVSVSTEEDVIRPSDIQKTIRADPELESLIKSVTKGRLNYETVRL